MWGSWQVGTLLITYCDIFQLGKGAWILHFFLGCKRDFYPLQRSSRIGEEGIWRSWLLPCLEVIKVGIRLQERRNYFLYKHFPLACRGLRIRFVVPYLPCHTFPFGVWQGWLPDPAPSLMLRAAPQRGDPATASSGRGAGWICLI